MGDKNMLSTDYYNLMQCLDNICDKFNKESDECNSVIIKGSKTARIPTKDR